MVPTQINVMLVIQAIIMIVMQMLVTHVTLGVNSVLDQLRVIVLNVNSLTNKQDISKPSVLTAVLLLVQQSSIHIWILQIMD
jgi:hypothetical protein